MANPNWIPAKLSKAEQKIVANVKKPRPNIPLPDKIKNHETNTIKAKKKNS